MRKEEILNKYICLLNSNKEVFIYGARICGEYVYKYLTDNNIKVKCFVDDDECFVGKTVKGVNVYPSSIIDNTNAVVVVAAVHCMYEISSKLKNKGFKNIIPFFILTLQNLNISDFCQFYDNLFDDYIENKNKYHNLFNIFKDELSKKTLDVLIQFRETYDWSLFAKVSQYYRNQYFDFFNYNNDVFVDGGCFDGDTTEQFIGLNKKYKKVYAFEPDPVSFKKVQVNLQKYNNINIFDKGLSDKQEILAFNALGDADSSFNEHGNSKVETVCLDDIVTEEKAFIKLDVEGFEYKTICGARRLISNNSKLAVALYHHPYDLWQIPELILSINKNYDFYLRHYSNTIFDTVIYAIPNV